jgi:hypothetical protein
MGKTFVKGTASVLPVARSKATVPAFARESYPIMFAFRVAIALTGATACAGLALPAAAQVADGAVLGIMRECSRIDDPSARLACYDNNMRSAGGAARNTVPGQVQVQGGGAVGPAMGAPAGFGREDLRVTQEAARAASGPDEILATVAQVSQRGPGLYTITLEDGAVWSFTESVSSTYRPPSQGSRIEIRRGALDSFLMRFNQQESVRVRRVQ